MATVLLGIGKSIQLLNQLSGLHESLILGCLGKGQGLLGREEALVDEEEPCQSVIIWLALCLVLTVVYMFDLNDGPEIVLLLEVEKERSKFSKKEIS